MTGAGDPHGAEGHHRPKTGAEERAAAWWDWHLFGLWVLVNGLAFVVIPLAGLVLEQLASLATKRLVDDHRALVVLIIAGVGAAFEGLVLGRWQWRLLRRRIADLPRRRWVIATLLPAFAVWLLVIAPEAADVLANGGRTLVVFREGFIQALVLGPLIGLSQAAALRGHTSRWAWWFAANVTTYLTGAALHVLGAWLKQEWSLPTLTTTFFPVVAFGIHGAWMLWVTAPQARGPDAPRSPTSRDRHASDCPRRCRRIPASGPREDRAQPSGDPACGAGP